MNEQVYKRLSTDEKELLGTLFETESMKAISHALEIYQLAKATHIATMSPDFDNVLVNRGNIEGARFAYDLCALAHSKMKKENTAK